MGGQMAPGWAHNSILLSMAWRLMLNIICMRGEYLSGTATGMFSETNTITRIPHKDLCFSITPQLPVHSLAVTVGHPLHVEICKPLTKALD